MDFLVLLLSNPRFLYSDNACGFLFALLERSHMRLKLCLFLQAVFRLAIVSFFQLVFLRLALSLSPFLYIVSYIVLFANGNIEPIFNVYSSIKSDVYENSIKSY